MHQLNALAAGQRMLTALSETERYQADLDAALAPQPGDDPLSAFNRAAKVITAFDVVQVRRPKTRAPVPTRALTDVEFDYEQARINDDWFIR
jgi:hypothetical protein